MLIVVGLILQDVRITYSRAFAKVDVVKSATIRITSMSMKPNSLKRRYDQVDPNTAAFRQPTFVQPPCPASSLRLF